MYDAVRWHVCSSEMFQASVRLYSRANDQFFLSKKYATSLTKYMYSYITLLVTYFRYSLINTIICESLIGWSSSTEMFWVWSVYNSDNVTLYNSGCMTEQWCARTTISPTEGDNAPIVRIDLNLKSISFIMCAQLRGATHGYLLCPLVHPHFYSECVTVRSDALADADFHR